MYHNRSSPSAAASFLTPCIKSYSSSAAVLLPSTSRNCRISNLRHQVLLARNQLQMAERAHFKRLPFCPLHHNRPHIFHVGSHKCLWLPIHFHPLHNPAMVNSCTRHGFYQQLGSSSSIAHGQFILILNLRDRSCGMIFIPILLSTAVFCLHQKDARIKVHHPILVRCCP